jgi:DtxR family Mn-dependent transcriptional regulator
MTRELTDSLENYLHAVSELERTRKVARVKDIAEILGVRMPSVTNALQSLGERGYINYAKNSYVTLTESGRRAAGCLTAKQRVMERFLADVLGVRPGNARRMARRMEHIIDCETNRRLIRMLEYFEGQRRSASLMNREDWLDFVRSDDDTIPALCSDWCDQIYQASQQQ